MNRQKRAFIYSIISILLMLPLLVCVTVAWLSMNKAVDNNGMTMDIDTIGNLVISDSSTTIGNMSAASWTDSYISYDWSEAASKLIPADHYDSTTYPTVSGTNAVGLVYNTNPKAVSRTTGKQSGTTALTYAHVPSDGGNKYYIDYTVYIASIDKALTVANGDYTNVIFTIAEEGTQTTTNTAYKSTSIDVYVDETYKGTLNLDTSSTFSLSDITSIPLNTSGSVKVLFRCYFDGALQNASDSTKNYVNSAALSTNNAAVKFKVTISLD